MTAATAEKSDAQVIAALKKELAAKEKEIEQLRPTTTVAHRLFKTTKEVQEYFGEKQLKDMLKTRIAAENKKLNRQGFDRLQYSAEEQAELLEVILQEFVDARLDGPPAEGWLTRTLKMVKPNGGDLVQVIYEGQVNNVAGSLADGLLVYEKKGYKRTDPFLCPAQNCWEEAAVVTSGRNRGKWEHSGYCSADHFERTEMGRQSQKVPGAEG